MPRSLLLSGGTRRCALVARLLTPLAGSSPLPVTLVPSGDNPGPHGRHDGKPHLLHLPGADLQEDPQELPLFPGACCAALSAPLRAGLGRGEQEAVFSEVPVNSLCYLAQKDHGPVGLRNVGLSQGEQPCTAGPLSRAADHAYLSIEC